MASVRTRLRKAECAVIIRRQLSWLALIGTCGLLIFASVSFTTLLQIEVNGPLYRHIRLSNNLVADYVPPSQSLLEPSLLCAKLVDAPDETSRSLYENSLKTFQRDYDSQYASYMARVPEGPLKTMMRGEAYETAQHYFELTDRLAVLVDQNRQADARTLLASTMNPLYDRHAAAVDQIVLRANEEARATEALAARKVRIFTIAMAVVGLLVLIVVCALSWLIAQGISAQADRLVHSEESLRESEELYRSTFDQAAVGIIHASFQGVILRCNARFAEILGYPVEEILGKTFQHFTPTEYRSESADLLQQLVTGASSTTGMEKPYLRKDGTPTWVKITSSVQHDGNGKPLHLATFIEDINARKAAESHLATATEALLLNETRYRTVFQTSRDALSISDLTNGKFTEVNQAFLELMGFEREELIGRTSVELGLWVNPKERENVVEMLRQNSGFQDEKIQLRKKNGEIFWALLSASLVEIEGVNCFLGVTRDISGAMAAEAHLATATEALLINEARYRTVFQTSIDALSITRVRDGMNIDVNPAMLNLLGYKPEEIINKSSINLGVWPDVKDRENLVEKLRQNLVLRDEKTQWRRKNGDIFWVLLSASLIEIEGIPCVFTVARDLSDARAAEDEIRNLAFYDRVTHLPNRRLLLDRLLQALSGDTRSSRKKILLFINLDDFKAVNDTVGHQIGDLLLQVVAHRLNACVHEADTVARFGGDEFVVICEGLSETPEGAADEAEILGEKILASLCEPYLLDGRECESTASIGITVFGDTRETPHEILQQAGIAMHQAKTAGGSTVRFFSPALQAAVNARAAMKEDLGHAISEDQFLLYYQPQVDATGLIGAEALIRWKHPVRGLVPPNDFIPLAEETGLILPLGDWALNTACKQIALWAARNVSVTIAVNISARQFAQPEFVENLLATLDRTGANPKNLKLELTESMLANNIEDVIAKMTVLKSHGLSFALDDFGTGYSSLSYLKRLPLDQLKIDRAFVSDILKDVASAAIAQTIISLGQAMNLSVIAEGIETEAQRDFLNSLGAHSFQGYLFSRPLPLEEFERLWLDAAKPHPALTGA